MRQTMSLKMQTGRMARRREEGSWEVSGTGSLTWQCALGRQVEGKGGQGRWQCTGWQRCMVRRRVLRVCECVRVCVCGGGGSRWVVLSRSTNTFLNRCPATAGNCAACLTNGSGSKGWPLRPPCLAYAYKPATLGLYAAACRRCVGQRTSGRDCRTRPLA